MIVLFLYFEKSFQFFIPPLEKVEPNKFSKSTFRKGGAK
jgi:hypothetical protein